MLLSYPFALFYDFYEWWTLVKYNKKIPRIGFAFNHPIVIVGLYYCLFVWTLSTVIIQICNQIQDFCWNICNLLISITIQMDCALMSGAQRIIIQKFRYRLIPITGTQTELCRLIIHQFRTYLSCYTRQLWTDEWMQFLIKLIIYWTNIYQKGQDWLVGS